MSDKALHVFYNGCDYVVAADEADAWAVYLEHAGGDRDDYGGDWRKLPDDKVLTCRDEDESELAVGTCSDWVAENGRGYLFSEDY